MLDQSPDAVKTLSGYRNWKPVFHTVIKDRELAHTIHKEGYAVIPFLNSAQLAEVKDLYQREHSIKNESGGMFYSLYSKDLAYRRRIHEGIAGVVKPMLDAHFTDYKNIVNTFITKISGPESEFYVHQDTSALDEFKHSPLSVWIALQDITPENGALGVIERSHWLFSPYRSISIPFPFARINNLVRQYLKPVYLKAGQAIVFDPRLVHHSMPNTSGADRLVALCGVFPQSAEFITCYRDKAPGSSIELIKHSDAFILENENFYYDCFARPKTGSLVAKIDENFPDMDAETFEQLCSLNGIEKLQALGTAPGSNCRFFAEPDGINRDLQPEPITPPEKTVWHKLKAAFGA